LDADPPTSEEAIVFELNPLSEPTASITDDVLVGSGASGGSWEEKSVSSGGSVSGEAVGPVCRGELKTGGAKAMVGRVGAGGTTGKPTGAVVTGGSEIDADGTSMIAGLARSGGGELDASTLVLDTSSDDCLFGSVGVREVTRSSYRYIRGVST
jgi:hypothetical protein